MSKIPWYVARSSGFVAWGLILATIVWGLLLATKVLGRRPTPAWLLSLHRYLGALTVAFVGVHVGAILLDSYTNFGITDVLVPLTGSWHPLAVAWGIVGMYLLAAIEITSLVRHKLSNRAWHAVHLLSYFLFATTTVQMLTAASLSAPPPGHWPPAGTDANAVLASSAAVLLGVAVTFGSVAMYVWRNDTGEPRPAARVRTRTTRSVEPV